MFQKQQRGREATPSVVKGGLRLHKRICLSGADMYELEEVFTGRRGVISVRTGYINAAPHTSHEEALHGTAGGRMGIEIVFDPKKIDISQILDLHFAVVTPYSIDGQGYVRGAVYRAGVFYESGEDEPQVSLYMSFLAAKGRAPATGESLTLNDPNSRPEARRVLHATMERLTSFQAADESHQGYLRRHPETETYIDLVRLRELVTL